MLKAEVVQTLAGSEIPELSAVLRVHVLLKPIVICVFPEHSYAK